MENVTTQPALASKETFLDEKQLLARLPISRRTAFTWVQSGKLPCVKIGRRKLFHWPSVEAALLRQQRNGIEP
jgi:predicted site-specific integrase-resolvase